MSSKRLHISRAAANVKLINSNVRQGDEIMSDVEDVIATKQQATNPRPGVLLIIGTVLAVILNAGGNFLAGLSATSNLSEMIGFIVGGVALFPLVVVGVASIWRSNRNPRRQTLVFFLTSLVCAFARIASFLGAVAKSVQNAQP
jgi:hypothetical protein